MDSISDFLSWAWERHHNPLSWYVRPLFVIPLCYFAYRRSALGLIVTIFGVASSMFWFPAPATVDPKISEFLEMEHSYLTDGWTAGKIAMTALVPIWFAGLISSFWRRSLLAGLVVVNLGAILKVAWSFHQSGSSAWSVVPAAALGALICNVALGAVMWRRRKAGLDRLPPDGSIL